MPLQLRAMLEALLLAIILWLPLLLFQSYHSPNLSQLAIDLLVGPLCMLYYVLRLRVPGDFLKRQSLVDTTVALLLGLALSGIVLVLAPWLLPGALPTSLWRGLDRTLLFAILSSMGDCSVFVVARLALRLWLFWDGLRRRQLLWALTHAHVMVLALGAALLPLSALVSYLVVGRVTNRLKSLATATSLLCGGDYAVRIPVAGEDEVARLQTDFNAMAANLERAMRQLQGERDTVAGLLQSRRELIVSVSHELRTPLATLRSYLETTLDHWEETPHAALQQDLQVMEDEVIRLQALVEDLFTLSRAEVGRLTLRCEPTGVAMLVKRIVETRAPLAWHASRIEVVADVPCDLPPALVDASRLEQVLQNLLHNAVRHTPPGGIVAVTATTGPDSIALQVKDTGEGIAPLDLPRIWERFYQANSERTPTTSGAGLGLALVKELIEGMGGSVSVDSVPGEGSCFTIHLPRAYANNTSSAIATPAHLEPSD